MFGGSRINTTRKPIKAVVGGFGGLFHGHKAFPQFLNFTLDILHVRFDFGHSIPDVFQLHNHGGKLGGFLGGVFLIIALQVGNAGIQGKGNRKNRNYNRQFKCGNPGIDKHPYANATFDGKTLYTHKHVHLSVAVGAEDGLMVPVVKNVDLLSVTEISGKIRDLAARAKTKSLRPNEQSGGTCTITNVGMFPIDIGTPVINPPQTAICGFGRTVLRPVILPDGSVGARSMMNVFLTFDHQILDGLEVGRILKDIQCYIEHPELILA